MSENMMPFINQLANLKQLDKKSLIEVINQSLFNAISKKLTNENELQILMDHDNNQISAKFKKLVVENDIELGEISLSQAQKIDPSSKLGDFVMATIPISDFDPKIIRNSRKAIQEAIKKLESDRIIFDYEKQKNQIVTGKLRKIEYKDYLIDLGYSDALLPYDEQIDKEYYKIGNIIQAYIIDIKRIKNRMTIILSRTHPEYIKKLFESEVPEVAQGEVVIKKIVREPGEKSKIAVFSNSDKIDPIGACFGEKGMRIKHIQKFLFEEQLEIISWDKSFEQFVANAIGINLVEQVYLAEHGRFARVVTKRKNKNIAIGRNGLNVKLAAKLTDYKIDIFTEQEFENQTRRERRIMSHIQELDGITENVEKILKEKGYTSVEDIFSASVDELCSIKGIGKKMAEKLKHSAENFF